MKSHRSLKINRVILKSEENCRWEKHINFGQVERTRNIGETEPFNKFCIAFDRTHLEQTSARKFLHSNGSFFKELNLKLCLTFSDFNRFSDTESFSEETRFIGATRLPGCTHMIALLSS